jgi:Arc/MetJ-type ribon-helix-helix transcriptional regulator
MVYRPVTGESYPNDPADYDPDEFYTADTGTETIRARVSSPLARAITEVVLEPTFPHYRTPSDVIRDAVVHLLHRRQGQMTDPIARQRIEDLLQTEREGQVIESIDEQAKRQEKQAGIIVSRYWKSTDRDARTSMYVQARKLMASGLLDDNLKDGLRRIIGHWQDARETEVLESQGWFAEG